MRSPALKLFAAVLAAVLLFGSGVSARVLFACSMTGKVGTSCCCSKSARAFELGELRYIAALARADRGETELAQVPCCTASVEVTGLSSPAVFQLVQHSVAALAEVPTVAVEFPKPAFAASVVLPIERNRGPPAVPVPLYILHRSFLS